MILKVRQNKNAKGRVVCPHSISTDPDSSCFGRYGVISRLSVPVKIRRKVTPGQKEVKSLNNVLRRERESPRLFES